MLTKQVLIILIALTNSDEYWNSAINVRACSDYALSKLILWSFVSKVDDDSFGCSELPQWFWLVL